MSEEPTKAEGIPLGRGEGLRQLIRRAKQVSRRQFAAQEKIRILPQASRWWSCAGRRKSSSAERGKNRRRSIAVPVQSGPIVRSTTRETDSDLALLL